MMAAARILDDAQLDEMARLREGGWGIERIAAHFTAGGTRIAGSTIAWQCRRVGADAPPRLRGKLPSGLRPYERPSGPVRPFSPEEDARLRELEASGTPVNAIARAMGRPHNSICGRLMTLARHDARAEEQQA